MRKQHWKKILLWVTPPCSQATLRLLLWVVLQPHFLGPCRRKQHHRKPKLFWHILFHSECLRRQNYFRVVTHQNNFEPEIVLVMVVKLNSSKYPNMLDLWKLFWKMILVGGPPSNNFIKAGGIIWTCENEPPVRDVSQILKSWNCENDAFARDVLQSLQVDIVTWCRRQSLQGLSLQLTFVAVTIIAVTINAMTFKAP